MGSIDTIPLPHFARNNGTKVILVATEGFEGAIEAQFNPHTVQIDKTVNWKEDTGHVAYDKGVCRTVQLELMFDVAEVQQASQRRSLSTVLDTLTKMTLPIDEKGTDSERRPPVLKIGNGPIPGLLCVIEQLSIKVTAYHHDMHEPIRATVTLKLKEVSWDAQRKQLTAAKPTLMTRG